MGRKNLLDINKLAKTTHSKPQLPAFNAKHPYKGPAPRSPGKVSSVQVKTDLKMMRNQLNKIKRIRK